MLICLFDIDGTLLASGGAGKAALESALTEDFQVELRVKVPYSGRTDRAIVRDLLHVHDIDETPEVRTRLFDGYLRRLPGCLRRHRGRILPGIDNLLAHLTARNHCALGLLTGNVRAGAKAKLGHFGLAGHFRFGGFGDHHFDRDDVAREALASVRKEIDADVNPENIWVIGDTPLDVRCARAIGAKVAAVATGVHPFDELVEAKPDVAVRDLSDPSPLLERWQ
ncbi:MAG: haloacid dehalogenase-like hydrolase [Gemmataceae bacterium]|nr:haloacid dehalogenase-like hydrolase [Gemmataceae bacterium]